MTLTVSGISTTDITVQIELNSGATLKELGISVFAAETQGGLYVQTEDFTTHPDYSNFQAGTSFNFNLAL